MTNCGSSRRAYLRRATPYWPKLQSEPYIPAIGKFRPALWFNNPKRRSLMSESFPLPTKPEDVVPSLIERFKSGRVSEVMALFEPKSVFVANDGRTITGH